MTRVQVVLLVTSLFLAGCSTASHTTTQPATVSDTSSATEAKESQPFDNLAGQWTGNAKVVVVWANQKQLPVKLDIAGDGAVSGTVGDATLMNARMRSGRGQFERSLGWGREYRIHGQLSGDMIQAEQIHRDAVDIVLDPSDGALVGGLNSSGSKFGGKESMILSAGDLRLQRIAATTRPKN
jgi:hypothetical protein